MLEIICDSDKEEVSNYSLWGKERNYTYKSLAYFRKKFPNKKIYFLMGSDCFKNFETWKNTKKILKNTTIVVFRRVTPVDLEKIKKYKAILLKNKVVDYSSSDVRQGNFGSCPTKIQEYIAKNYLYLEDFLKQETSIARFQHCKKVAQIAKTLAKKANISQKKAYFAGLLHDLTKEWSNEKHQEFLISQNQNVSKIATYQFHQITAALWLKNIYKLKSKEVIRAIQIHTSLALKVSKLAKILFIADKISKFSDDIIKKLIEKDLDSLFQEIVEKNYKFLKSENKVFSKEQQEIYNKWRKQT